MRARCRVSPAVRLLAATGLTADQPNTAPSPALSGSLNNAYPFPAPGLAFYDTTLSKAVYFVGTGQSSTGWVDYTGASA
jgi:hypothetical protein